MTAPPFASVYIQALYARVLPYLMLSNIPQNGKVV